MKTQYFTRHQLQEAGTLLKNGACVAFPTETVYGLGANALDESAVEKIFQAKGRPSDNPLIVHVSSIEMLDSLVTELPPIAEPLIQRFWPGPLTLVLPKSSSVPEIVTAGLTTVAVRMPNHPWALELIAAANVPVAAPSANRSGSPSGTTWEAVREDLDGRIAGIVCGPPTEIGIESTVLDISGACPRLLRPGKVSFEEIRKIIPDVQAYRPRTDTSKLELSALNSPGLRHRHYQPAAKVILVQHPDDPISALPKESADSIWYLGLTSPSNANRYGKSVVAETVEAYAMQLFQFYRDADANGIHLIVCQNVDERGLGAALMDRLRRSAEDSRTES